MTTADRPRFDWTWLAHQGTFATVAAAVAATFDAFGENSWIRYIVVFPILLWWTLTAIAENKHDGQLCMRCAKKFPLDASAEAERKHLQLRLAHSFRGKGLIVIFAVLAGSFYLLPRPWGNLPFWLLIVVGQVISRTHFKLQLWCPWCRRPDGGGSDTAPVTPPPPVGVRTR